MGSFSWMEVMGLVGVKAVGQWLADDCSGSGGDWTSGRGGGVGRNHRCSGVVTLET